MSERRLLPNIAVLRRLSANAQKLGELAGLDGDLATLLQEQPELMDGLDEYLKWRDAQQQLITAKEAVPKHGHPLAALVKKKTKE